MHPPKASLHTGILLCEPLYKPDYEPQRSCQKCNDKTWKLMVHIFQTKINPALALNSKAFDRKFPPMGH